MASAATAPAVLSDAGSLASFMDTACVAPTRDGTGVYALTVPDLERLPQEPTGAATGSLVGLRGCVFKPTSYDDGLMDASLSACTLTASPAIRAAASAGAVQGMSVQQVGGQPRCVLTLGSATGSPAPARSTYAALEQGLLNEAVTSTAVYGTLKAQYDVAAKELDALIADNVRTSNSLQSTLREAADLRSGLAAAQASNTVLDARRRGLAASNADVRNKIATLDAQEQEDLRQFNLANAQITAAVTNSAGLRSAASAAVASAKRLHVEAQQLQASTASDQATLANLQAQYNTLLSTLTQGERLKPEDRSVFSPDRRYVLLYQGDGNLAVWFVGSNPARWVWQAHVTKPRPGTCTVTAGGKVVLLEANGSQYWASDGGGGAAPFKLTLGNDGVLLLTDATGRVVWRSTNNTLPAGWGMQDNQDYPFNDLSALPNQTQPGCAAECDKRPDCTAAAFGKDNGYCWLKSKLAGQGGFNTQRVTLLKPLTCGQTASTPRNDEGGGNVIYLDRHSPDCGDGAISRFHLQRDGRQPNGLDNYHYDFSCCPRLPSGTTDYRKSASAPTNPDPRRDPSGVNAGALKYLDMDCGGNGVLSRFHLTRPTDSTIQYEYTCKQSAVPLQCVTKYTPGNDAGNGNTVYLDRHDVTCDPGYALGKVAVRRNGNTLWYEYKCCKPAT